MQDPKAFQKGNVLAISFAHLLHDIYSSFLAPILPLLIQKLHFSLGLAGLLSLVQRLPSLLNPLIGLMADRVNLRYLIIISPSVTAVSMSLLGLAPRYGILVILCFTMGISATLFHVPSPVMIKQVSGDRVGKGMSIYMTGGELARTLGPLTILGAVSLWGLNGTYRLIPFGVLTSLLLYFRIRKIRISDQFPQKDHPQGIKKSIGPLVPLFVLITGYSLSRALMKSALTTFLPTYLTFKGASIWMGGISLSILQLTGALGTLYCGSLSDRIGRKKTLLLMSIISPLLMGLFLCLKGIWTFPLLMLMGFFLFAPTPVMLALVQDTARGRPALANSIYMTINFFVAAVTNVMVGILGDQIGLERTYIIAAFIAILAIPFALKTDKYS